MRGERKYAQVKRTKSTKNIVRIPEIKKGTIVEIEWYDSSGQDGWVDTKAVVHGLAKVKTIGYLFKQTKDVVTVIMADGDNEVLVPNSIPTYAITSLREIK